MSASRWSRVGPVEVALFVLALWPALYFNNGANVPQVSRLDAIFAFVEPGTPDTGSFRIDRFVRTGRSANTIDWARNPEKGPEAYSNKAPGLQMAAVPVYALLFHGSDALGARPTWPSTTYVLAWLLNVLVQGPLGALLLPVLYRLGRDPVGLSPLASAAVALALWYGTGLAPFHTQFWGHTPAAALVALALHGCLRGAPLRCGVFAGLGVLFDYSLVIPLVGFAAWIAWRDGSAAIGRFVLGGLPPFALYAAYHLACFGHPLAPAILYNNPLFLEAEAAAGVLTLARFGEALWGITFSPYRGLFFFWPVCLLALAAPFVRGAGPRPLVVLCVANALAFLLANASFNGWPGGSTLGPRYQIAALPFYGVLGAMLVKAAGEPLRERPAARRVAWLVAVPILVWSCANALLGQAISPLAPDVHLMPGPGDGVDWTRPLSHYYERLARGELQPHALIPIRSPGETPEAVALRTWNLGERIGLGPHAALMLYLATTGAAVAATLARTRRTPPRDAVA